MDEYRKLQKHLNSQAVPFPATMSGTELKILKHIFTPDEAEIASNLSFRFESVKKIHSKINKTIDLNELEKILDNILEKGGIAYKAINGESHYCNISLVMGMYEGQLFRLSEDFLKDFKKYIYHPSFAISYLSTSKPQMRTIPIAKSITPEHKIEAYDKVQDLIEKSQCRVIVECICQKAVEVGGGHCNATSRKERCLALDDLAAICIKLNLGREISKKEALEIMELNQKDSLIHQVSNAKKPDVICSCCSCCCGMLDIQKNLPRPKDFWATNFYAQIDPKVCNGCGSCAKICQANAVDYDKKKKTTTIKIHRCIGCGNCVVVCKSNAISLLKNDEETIPPDTSEDLFEEIYQNKKNTWEKFKMIFKIIFRIK